MKPELRKDLAILVHVQADLTAMWDGKEYDLLNGVQIQNGVVERWQEIYPDVTFTLEEVTETLKKSREIQNPLEENDRGEAFAKLRKPRKPVG